tara:strand:- start:11832 stop:14861 length:3030 start_codon:yes stop_codon:yes gene_type:complete
MSETICILLVCDGVDQDTLERSLLSLVTQAGDFYLHIHVQNVGQGALKLAPFLAQWQARLGAPETIIYCRDVWLSYENSPATGFNTALCEGSERLSENADNFMGWLRVGDVFLPGALAHVAELAQQFTAHQLSWIQGAAGQLSDEELIAGILLHSPTALVARGLCDGVHWPAVFWGGMFFRAGLWRTAQAHIAFEGEEALSEWRVWQRLAQHASLVQSPQVMGVFASAASVMPPPSQANVLRQIEHVSPVAHRSDLWKEILRKGPILQHKIVDAAFDSDPADVTFDTPIRIVATDITTQAKEWAVQQDLWPQGMPDRPPLAPQTVASGKSQTGQYHHRISRPRHSGPALADIPSYRRLLHSMPEEDTVNAREWAKRGPLIAPHPAVRRHPIWQASRIRAWDQGWDRSEDTEWAALRAVQDMGEVPYGTDYIGFPWGQLITAQSKGTARYQRGFEAFIATLPYTEHRITTCQHPDLIAHLDIFKQARVTDIFWPYATRARIQNAAQMGISLHLLPHYVPVLAEGKPKNRLLSDADDDTQTLCQSLFAICSDKEQPNKPGLWRAIAAGAIPVLPIAEPEHVLPGPAELWRAAVVLWNPSNMTRQALISHLNALSQDATAMAEHHRALAQLRLLTGAESFGHPIHALMAAQGDARLAQQGLAAPGRIANRIRIYHLGPRAARSPLGYSVFERLAGNRITRAKTPADADIVLTGWNRDLAENPELLAQGFAKNPDLRCMVISEEPLWDTVWSGGYVARDRPFECAGKLHSYRYLNHVNSKIFEFEHVPYFLLTAAHFAPRYISMLGRYAQMRPSELLRRWQQAPVVAAFMAEYRDDPVFDFSDPANGVRGLCRYRTQVAQATHDPQTLRIGLGWPETEIRRQDLPDWHLDKITRLQGQVRLCAAYENTHVRSYITEKPFDAFAIGAMPVCYASPDHRLHELIAPGAMINTYDQSPETAAAWIGGYTPDISNAESWLETAAALRGRFMQANALAAERQRITEEVLREINVFLNP